PYGVTANSHELTLLITRRLPTFTRLIGQTAIASLGTAGVARTTESFPFRLLALLGPPPAYSPFLFDVFCAFGIESRQLAVAQQFYGKAMADLQTMTILVGILDLVQPYAATDVCAAIAGGAISSAGDPITPGIPGSYLEAPVLDPLPELNNVWF